MLMFKCEMSHQKRKERNGGGDRKDAEYIAWLFVTLLSPPASATLSHKQEQNVKNDAQGEKVNGEIKKVNKKERF